MRSSIERTLRTAVAVLIVLSCCAGCTYFGKGSKAPVAEAPQPSYFVHTVRWPGETLSIVAAWYTGSIDTWKELAAANPDINPDRIFVGNKIRIPENLMKTKDPMPEDFLWNFIAKPKKETQPSKSPSSPKKEEEPELFGPKEFPRK